MSINVRFLGETRALFLDKEIRFEDLGSSLIGQAVDKKGKGYRAWIFDDGTTIYDEKYL